VILVSTSRLKCQQSKFSRVSKIVICFQMSLKMFSKLHSEIREGDRLSKEALLPETEVSEPRQSSSLTRKFLGTHIAIFSLYTILFLIAWKLQGKSSQSFVDWTFSNHCKSLPQHLSADVLTFRTAPASQAVEIIPLVADIDSPNSFRGNPSVEVDQAWRDLMRGRLIPPRFD
jgi:hypothetical protein